MIELPKSTKKEGAMAEGSKGTSFKPLLITDWSNLQIASYCDTCGISFTDPVDDCVNYIRSLELSRTLTNKGLAEASSGGCGN